MKYLCVHLNWCLSLPFGLGRKATTGRMFIDAASPFQPPSQQKWKNKFCTCYQQRNQQNQNLFSNVKHWWTGVFNKLKISWNRFARVQCSLFHTSSDVYRRYQRCIHTHYNLTKAPAQTNVPLRIWRQLLTVNCSNISTLSETNQQNCPNVIITWHDRILYLYRKFWS